MKDDISLMTDREVLMDYKRFGQTIIARLDKGEEILEQLQVISLKENIKLASVSALGATNDIKVGVLNTAEKQYHAKHFTGDMEIVSLTGTVRQLSYTKPRGPRKKQFTVLWRHFMKLPGQRRLKRRR